MADPFEPLLEDDVDPDPLVQFGRWFDDAATVVASPEAMAVATADDDGRPSVRMVLLKAWGEDGFVFHTNYDSRKGHELADNPHAALLFYWEPRGRQVRIEGPVERTERRRVRRLLRHPAPRRPDRRPRLAPEPDRSPSRRSAGRQRWRLSSPSYAGRPVPRPPWWGGLRVRPQVFEFWQNRQDRLHDRLRYTPDGRWLADRPAPALTGRSRIGRDRRHMAGRSMFVVMADDTTLVNERIDQLLDELDPRTAPVEKFRARQFDLGLAWVSFPEGCGGLGLPPDLQREVDRRLGEAGATPPGAREFFGLTMAGPTVVTHGSDELRNRLLRRTFTGEESWCQLFSEPGPGRTSPAWPPGPSATATSGSSPGRRCGTRWPTSPTGACWWPAPIPRRPSTRA